MPTIKERLAAAKEREEKAVACRRKLESIANKRTREETTRAKIIIGAGAMTGGLIDQALSHVSSEDRAFALGVLRDNETAKAF